MPMASRSFIWPSDSARITWFDALPEKVDALPEKVEEAAPEKVEAALEKDEDGPVILKFKDIAA